MNVTVGILMESLDRYLGAGVVTVDTEIEIRVSSHIKDGLEVCLVKNCNVINCVAIKPDEKIVRLIAY